MKSKLIPSAYASAQMPIASCPLVRNRRSRGSPVTRDVTGSLMCSRGIHCRAPISACPVPSRTYARCTVLMPLATRPAHPRYCLLTPAVASALLLLPGLVQRPDRIPPARRFRRAASSSPATANRRTTLIAASVIPAGMIQQPLRPVRRPGPRHAGRCSTRCTRGSSLISAATYLPACSHTCVRAKHGRSSLQQPGPFPQRQPRAYPDGSSRLRFCCHHKHMNRTGGCPLCPRHPATVPAGHDPKCGCRAACLLAFISANAGEVGHHQPMAEPGAT